MENWKEKAEKILQEMDIDISTGNIDERTHYILEAMKEFAILSCTEQREKCYENAEIDIWCSPVEVNEKSIINARTIEIK